MEKLLALAVVMIALMVVMKALESRLRGKRESLPYQCRDYFFSKAERSFFDVLRLAVADEYFLFAKVRIADVLQVKKGTEQRQGHQNKINAKHIDFLLCSRDFVRPVLGIELDDKSHEREDRMDRDDFVNNLFNDAGLPLLRIPAKRTYAPNELQTLIKDSMSE